MADLYPNGFGFVDKSGIGSSVSNVAFALQSNHAASSTVGAFAASPTAAAVGTAVANLINTLKAKKVID